LTNSALFMRQSHLAGNLLKTRLIANRIKSWHSQIRYTFSIIASSPRVQSHIVHIAIIPKVYCIPALLLSSSMAFISDSRGNIPRGYPAAYTILLKNRTDSFTSGRVDAGVACEYIFCHFLIFYRMYRPLLQLYVKSKKQMGLSQEYLDRRQKTEDRSKEKSLSCPLPQAPCH